MSKGDNHDGSNSQGQRSGSRRWHTPDKEEMDKDCFQSGSRSSNRENRLQRRRDLKGKDYDLYKDVLQGSGIDTSEMDEAEREQIAKILLLSKSEAEGQVWSEEKMGESRSASRGSSNQSSSDSVICLEQNTLKEDPMDYNTQDLQEFEDKDTQNFAEGSPLNCSMSQIFSQVDSDDETQRPTSQDYPSTQRPTPPDCPSHKDPLLFDCPTMAADEVDGDTLHHHGNSNQGSSSQDSIVPMDFQQKPSIEVIEAEVHKSKGTDSEMTVQSQDSQGSNIKEVQSQRKRKRKASNSQDPSSKQSRVDLVEDPHTKMFSLDNFLLDGDRCSNIKPLRRRYRRQRRLTKEKKFYSLNPSTVECNRYTDVIVQLLNRYCVELREAQCGRLCHVEWGNPVKVGRHMSRTIDVKQRGRDSCYMDFSDDSDSDDNRNSCSRKAPVCKFTDNDDGDNVISYHETGKEKSADTQASRTLRTRSSSQNSEDDFCESLRVSGGTSKKVLPDPEEVTFLDDVTDDGWMTTRGNNSARNERKGRKKIIQKPPLDFSFGMGDSKLSPVKTYARIKRSLPQNKVLDVDETMACEDTPIDPQTSWDKDEIEVSQSSLFQRVSPLFQKNKTSSAKKSSCKTFTFASTSSGEIKVSEKISPDDCEDDFLLPPSLKDSHRVSSFPTSPTFSKSSVKNVLDSKRGNSVNSQEVPITYVSQETESMAKKRTNFSNKSKGQKNTKKVVARQLELDDNLNENHPVSILDLADNTDVIADLNDEGIVSDQDNIPSSAVFSAKKKRRSLLFSEDDESFSLGISPAKAFPAAFESLSDESPSTSKQTVLRNNAENSEILSSPTFEKKLGLVRPSIHVKKPTKREEKRTTLCVEVEEITDQGLQAVSSTSNLSRKRNRKNEKVTEVVPPDIETRPEETAHQQGEDNEDLMDCPLCGMKYSQKVIETHAATCNGEVTGNPDVDGANDWRDILVSHDQAENQQEGEEERCYICDGTFTKGDNYRQHVDKCLEEAKRQQAEIEQGFNNRRGRTTRNRCPVPIVTDDTSDEDVSSHGNPRGGRERQNVEELRVETVSEEEPCFTPSDSESSSDSPSPKRQKSHSRETTKEIDFDSVSDSPIRSFQKIDQMENCLIDFSNQLKKSDKVKRKPIKSTTKRKRTRKKGKKKVAKRK